MYKSSNITYDTLNETNFMVPSITYMSSSSARVIRDKDALKEDLAYNMSNRVLWHDAIIASYERGFRLCIEVTPGSTLTKLTKPVFHNGEAVAIFDVGLKNVVALYKKIKNG